MASRSITATVGRVLTARGETEGVTVEPSNDRFNRLMSL
jgi:hypothetical protein